MRHREIFFSNKPISWRGETPTILHTHASNVTIEAAIYRARKIKKMNKPTLGWDYISFLPLPIRVVIVEIVVIVLFLSVCEMEKRNSKRRRRRRRKLTRCRFPVYIYSCYYYVSAGPRPLLDLNTCFFCFLE